MALNTSNNVEVMEHTSFMPESDFFKLAFSFEPLNASTAKTLSGLPRIADANNCDDTYLSLFELQDILVSQRERAIGLNHKFSRVEDMLAWLHSD